MTDTIYLDPDLFMALGLSAEANGGIGRGPYKDGFGPCCAHGHAAWLDGADSIYSSPSSEKLYRASLYALLNDDRLEAGGVEFRQRVTFSDWCRIVGVDLAA